MGRLLTGFAIGLESLTGTAALLALARLVLQVRDLVRLTRQLSDPHHEAGGPWEFADRASPPGWLLPHACGGTPGMRTAGTASVSTNGLTSTIGVTITETRAFTELTRWRASS